MMSDHGANPILFNKKIKIGRPEHSLPHHLPPTPLRPITSHFDLNCLKVDVCLEYLVSRYSSYLVLFRQRMTLKTALHLYTKFAH